MKSGPYDGILHLTKTKHGFHSLEEMGLHPDASSICSYSCDAMRVLKGCGCLRLSFLELGAKNSIKSSLW